MSIDSIIQNDFLKLHLKYVYHTEPPKIMHIWSAITTASACMARHVWCDTGLKRHYANNYCLLVGPPGTRKSSAVHAASKLMREATEVKFAPDDTGGQRQGLIAAIQDSTDDATAEKAGNLLLGDLSNLVNLGDIKLNLSPEKDPDTHAMFIEASEFGSFLGQGSLDMTRFLVKMWDCEPYKYKLKKEELVLKEPMLTILGCTTSSDLATLLPIEAIGQGFMSRIILVFASGKEKSVPPSKAFLDKTYKEELKAIYRYLFYDLKGGLTKTKAAERLEDKIYSQNIKLADTRFIFYSERRVDHLAKTALTLAACRRSKVIEETDYHEANEILAYTEKYMTDALGEYGLSPLAVSRQKMVEFIRQANGPVHSEILWLMLRKDMRLLDFKHSIQELVDAKKISQVKTTRGIALVYNDNADSELLSLVADDIVA